MVFELIFEGLTKQCYHYKGEEIKSPLLLMGYPKKCLGLSGWDQKNNLRGGIADIEDQPQLGLTVNFKIKRDLNFATAKRRS